MLRRLLVFLFCLTPTLASAQHLPTPANRVMLGGGFQIDLPAGWARNGRLDLFRARGGSALVDTFHPTAARPDALPYAVLETFNHPPAGTGAEADDRRAFAGRIAAFYETALTPPGRSDAAAAWKSSRLTPVRFDAAGRHFAFEATLRYADRPGNYHLAIVGAFGVHEIRVLSVWSDDATQAGASTSIADSFRLTDPGMVQSSPKARLPRAARIDGAIVLVTIIGIQVFVWLRERRARADAGDEA